ncbi:hypothetical protein EX30DRAFT_340263 [Ascodesmis nigricans]|uniref:P-loop containing nucleoside triphosphate hydrolase protein n=1 Tax=Ascodesmis nigricans TaxID=341454 RepID=A0A4S2MYS6_9PEZI|nr:hypothetical protein EX30DRAFT_340263 [Ascodesmis nigricans]
MTRDSTPPPSSQPPIILATHPRACSTAFERVLMQSPHLHCIHEPFGDAYYYGPERLGNRFDGPTHTSARESSGFSTVTYRHVVDALKSPDQLKRVFIKDITHYLVPPPGSTKYGLAKSLGGNNGQDENNPTVIPLEILRRWNWSFLIRHPRDAIPSYYRCTQPPLAEKTGFKEFFPEEAGYREMRLVMEYLLSVGVLKKEQLVVVDAEDLLAKPREVMKTYCEMVGVRFDDEFLSWEKGCGEAKKNFEKWNGFHEDAIHSSGLQPREEKQKKSDEEVYEGWVEKWGKDAAELIRRTVEENIEDYEWLRQFRTQV